MLNCDLTVASLFSGCGGFDIGFQSEGFRSIAAYDIDPAAIATFNANIRPVAEVCDLSQFTPDVRPDVLLAGSPCQGFSTSGKRDLDDPRNNLLLRAGEIARIIRPKVFLLENVPAAISGPHGSRWERVEEIMRSDGYNVRRIVADGPSSGVPQIRKRLFLLAWRGSDAMRCEPPVRAAPSIIDAISGIGNISGHDPVLLAPGSREHRIARRIGSGQKLCNVRISPAAVHTWNIPEVFGSTTEAEHRVLETVVRLRRRDRRRTFGDADPVEPFRVCDLLGRCYHKEMKRLIAIGYLRQVGQYIDLKNTYNGKFRRLSLDGPSPTVDTHFGNPALFLHPREDRGLTPREAARIQGFDDAFDFGAGRARAFRMIGNAVPPPMAARLAGFIREAILPIAA
jgi:DNA (cytosine-5)-methyltransferase 1